MARFLSAIPVKAESGEFITTNRKYLVIPGQCPGLFSIHHYFEFSKQPASITKTNVTYPTNIHGNLIFEKALLIIKVFFKTINKCNSQLFIPIKKL
jgi:hypothetical protein